MSRSSYKISDGCASLVALLFGLAIIVGTAWGLINYFLENEEYISLAIVIIIFAIAVILIVRKFIDILYPDISGQTVSKKRRDYGYRRTVDLSQVDSLEGHDFEYWCADLLMRNGFSRVNVTRASGDDGLDIIAYHGTAKWGIQCKRSNSKVTNKAVQEAFTGKALYDCQYVAVITNNYFTPSAVETAKKTQVLLWDRDWITSKLYR